MCLLCCNYVFPLRMRIIWCLCFVMDSFVFFHSVPLGKVSQGYFSCHGGGYDISQVTISFVYIMTAIVVVKTSYELFLFNFLYRDLFATMIIGCAWSVTLPMSLLSLSKVIKHHPEIRFSLWSYGSLHFFMSAIHFVYIVDPLVTFRYFRDMSLSSILLSGWQTAFANITCLLMVCQMSRI